MKLQRMLIAATLGMVTLLWSTATSAVAAPADDTSVIVERALTSSPAVTQGASATLAGTGTASAFTDAVGGSVKSENRSAGISLLTPTSAKAEVAAGSRTFRKVATDTSAAVRVGQGAIQVLTVMRSEAAATEQSYRVDVPANAKIVSTGAGYSIVEANSSVTGTIAAPWAVDATGRSLNTYYTLQGTTVTQHTDTTGAVFPVVADPRLTYGLGVYLNMWGAEARVYAIAAVAVLGTGTAIGCTLIGNIPYAALRSLALLACGAGAVNLTKVFNALRTLYTSTGIVDSWCYQMKIIPTSNTLNHVSGSNC
jgi:hypothetical protein